MIFPKSSHPDRPIFVQPGAGDMRKQINGLAVMVQNSIGQNPYVRTWKRVMSITSV